MSEEAMSEEPKPGRTSHQAEEFMRQAEAAEPSQVRELLAFVRQEKKWFLLPIIITLLIAGLFVILGGTAVAPFIYTIF